MVSSGHLIQAPSNETGYHSAAYEILLLFNALQCVESQPTFRGKMSLPSSVLKCKPIEKAANSFMLAYPSALKIGSTYS
jgi:hypothetical protein